MVMMTAMDNPGVMVATADELSVLEDERDKLLEELEAEVSNTPLLSSIAGHILSTFQTNKDARSSSGMDEKLMQSLRAYNGHYDPEDLARIEKTNGSSIYMNLTATKCRAAISWIKDILMPNNKDSVFMLSPTPVPEIPDSTVEEIRNHINSYIIEEPTTTTTPGMGEQQQQQQQQKVSPIDAANKLHEQNQIQKDIEDAISSEIYRIASKGVKKYEKRIHDELVEGKWDKALSEFIEDFCVFQVAIMKGPVVSKKKSLTWVDGVPELVHKYVYLNERVSPLDIYPSPNATSIEDGNLCEHIRLHRKELYNLIGAKGYEDSVIRDILNNSSDSSTMYSWVDNNIESEKVDEEFRGDQYGANKGVYHGIHYFGTASYDQLVSFGMNLDSEDSGKEYDVEAILIGNQVIKLVIMDDPLLRRPYYKASFQNIPGSWWGRSLPELMRDIQRVCNGTARALLNNLGISSGPQVEVNIERLAADEDLEDMYPWKMWQTTNDPTGAGGKAISFFQPSSNAGDLLAVYDRFELKADDATGIPRYAYGNENTRGASATASGLAMLLDSASKGIKNAIRHIDEGLIKPRVEYQFYYDMVTDTDANFTGDIKVVPRGSGALTLRGSQEMRRNEFLQIVASPSISQIVGIEGIAEILREMSKGLGLGEDIIPSRVELRFKQKQAEQDKQAQAQAQAQQGDNKASVGIKQVEMQTQQADIANQRRLQLQKEELDISTQQKEKDRQVKIAQLMQQRELATSKELKDSTRTREELAYKDRSDNKKIALKLQEKNEIKQP